MASKMVRSQELRNLSSVALVVLICALTKLLIHSEAVHICPAVFLEQKKKKPFF